MPKDVLSTTPPEILHYDTLLHGIQRLNGHTATIESDLRALLKTQPEGLRPAMEKLAEDLISFLDETAGDPDLEPDNDAEEGGDEEPTLGSVDCINQERWSQGSSHSFFQGDELELDRADYEPNLAAPESSFPTDQTNWADGNSDDREDDPAELGIADQDGLMEQTVRTLEAQLRQIMPGS